jgi:hypothetical protein
MTTTAFDSSSGVLRRTGAACALFAATLPALADTPVMFTQAGRIDITFVANAGGFDHIVQPVIVGGNGLWNAAVPEGLAWIVGTEGGSMLNLVGDPNAPRSPTAFNTVWGYFDDVPAGTEITVRLTNVFTDRIGGLDPDEYGTIYSQLFSGSSSVNNVEFSGGSVAGGTPGAPNFNAPLPGGYSRVTHLSPTQIQLGFTDLFLDPNGSFDNVVLLFTLTPVPEPGTLAYLLAGLAVMAGVARRMR